LKKFGTKHFFSVALVSTLALAPYGNINPLLEKRNPWRAFQAEDPILTGVRVSRAGPDQVPSCAPWIHAFTSNMRGIQGGPQWSAWLPFEKDEKEAIEDCHEEPCAVKLNEKEVAQMATVAQSGKDSGDKSPRFEKFLSLVLDRATAYKASGVRSEYEYTGGITDPWAYFEKNGYKTDLVMPVTPNLGLRKLDFHNSRVRPIRQMVDRRVAVSKNHTEASLWIRDIYSNHYFDAWGEWGHISCDPQKHEVTVVLATNVEFDVLKNHGLFASISRGSAKGSMQTLTEDYLDQWWSEIKASADKEIAGGKH
jgi:hypothetical protein